MTRKPADSLSHREIVDLLPWYVNGTLPPNERDAVAAHLAECQDCHAELRTLQAVGDAVKESNERLPFPADDGFDALLSRIGRAEEAPSPRRKPGARPGSWWASLPAFARWALAAQAVAVVALACASVVLWRRANHMEAEALRERQHAEALQQREQAGGAAPTPTPAVEKPQYEALSGPQREDGGPSVAIVVVFSEGATAGEIRELLGAAGATIVSGPSSVGHYVIRVGVPPGADARRVSDETLALLRARRGVVRLAEPRP